MFDDLLAGRATRATRETPGESELLATYAEEHRQLLQSKETNARALIKGIQSFANGHRALAENRTNVNETIAVARKYADELGGVIAAFKS